MWQFFSDLLLFIVTILSYWQAYATGGIITGGVGLFERLTDNRLTKRAYVALFVFTFLFAAFFLAWRDEHQAMLSGKQEMARLQQETAQAQRALSEEKQRNSPYLKGELDRIGIGTNEEHPGKNTLFFIALTLRNLGAPSIADT
jgi:hypothetical protein